MGLQRVGHDWVTELNWTELDCSLPGLPVHYQFWELLKLMSIELVMPSNCLILCRLLLLLLSIFPNISVFSNESALCIRGPKYWSFSFNISFLNEYSGLISFRMDRLDLLTLHHHSSKASLLWHSAFFIIQLSHPYKTTEKTIALTRWTFVEKVMSQLFNSKQESPTLAAAAFTLDNTVMHKCRLSVPDLWFSREPCYQH